MAILEILDKKIKELKDTSPEELEKMTRVLNIVNEALDALADEKKLIDYDFNVAIGLVNRDVNSFGIIDLNKSILDIKNVLILRQKFHIDDLTYSEEQTRVLNYFKERLESLKRDLTKLIEDEKNREVDNELIENLESFQRVLTSQGKRKNYTEEMLEAFFEVVDYNSLSYDDIKELSNLLNISKNGKQEYTDESLKDEVIGLLKEYTDNIVLVDLINQYSAEICSTINLENAKKILELFKKENILNRFSIKGLLKILVRGRYDFIKDFYYSEVLPSTEELKDIYFDETLACVWVNEKKSERTYSKGIRAPREKLNKTSLCGDISPVSHEEVIENIRILKENEDILHDKYNLEALGELWVLTKPSWLLKKNIDLFRTFGIKDVQISAIAQNDLENKFHLAVELGLLNTPRNSTFRLLEEKTPKYYDFAFKGHKKAIYSNSILNYYQRNTTKLASTSYTEFIFWFYQIQRSSKEEFYQLFFSSKKAGTRSTEDYAKEDKEILRSESKMQDLIDENFVINRYSSLINHYDTYLEVIKEFNESNDSDIVIPYYDLSLLEGEEVFERIEQFAETDRYNFDGKERIVNNEYAYTFGDTIISRYKVLRNLTILKRKFGYLDNDMLLTAIFYNSYVDDDIFHMIEENALKGAVK